MPKKILRRILPNQESIRKIEVSRRFTSRLDLPEIWVIQREKIALGLAIGVCCGMIPGPLQMISAIGLTLYLRVNLPMALIGTFLTNPLTIVPIYMLAYAIGQSALGSTDWRQLPEMPVTDWTSPAVAMETWISWLGGLGMPWLIGMLLLAAAFSALAYCAVQLIWRVHQHLTMNRRRSQRLQRRASLRRNLRDNSITHRHPN
jgi:uncharacterized protein (DUF2062 family)